MITLNREQFFPSDLPFYVNRVAESYTTALHAHDFIECNYVAEGKGAHYINGKPMASTRGDLFILQQGTTHVFRPSSPEDKHPFIVYNCLILPEWIGQIGRAAPLPQNIVHVLTGKDGDWLRLRDLDGGIHRLFLHLFEEFQLRRPAYDTRMYGQVLELIGRMELLHTGVAPEQASQRSSEQQFEYSLRIMRERLSQPKLTAAEVAAQVGMDPSRLFRLYRKFMGTTFLACLQGERVELACKLLRETSLKVPHIAESCGYSDVKHFHRVFRAHTGTSPHQYRLRKNLVYSPSHR